MIGSWTRKEQTGGNGKGGGLYVIPGHIHFSLCNHSHEILHFIVLAHGSESYTLPFTRSARLHSFTPWPESGVFFLSFLFWATSNMMSYTAQSSFPEVWALAIIHHRMLRIYFQTRLGRLCTIKTEFCFLLANSLLGALFFFSCLLHYTLLH